MPASSASTRRCSRRRGIAFSRRWTRAGDDVPLHDTMLVVVGRGTSDSDANSNVNKVMRMLWEGFGFGWGEVCYSGVTFPLVEPGLRHAARLGYRRIVVFPYFLFTGVLVKRIYDHTDQGGGRAPGDRVPEGRLPERPPHGARRLHRSGPNEILNGENNMNCKLCKYRAQILGLRGGGGLAAGEPSSPRGGDRHRAIMSTRTRHSHAWRWPGHHHHHHGHDHQRRPPTTTVTTIITATTRIRTPTTRTARGACPETRAGRLKGRHEPQLRVRPGPRDHLSAVLGARGGSHRRQRASRGARDARISAGARLRHARHRGRSSVARSAGRRRRRRASRRRMRARGLRDGRPTASSAAGCRQRTRCCAT